MDTQRWKKLEALFNAALELTHVDRAAFLTDACADDEALHKELVAMLKANEGSMAMALEERLLTEDDSPEAIDLVGTHIGHYRLEKLIGEGGMGEVYLAQRDDAQYKQHVALKLVRPGYRNNQIMARFRMERQVLARLTHPNITQLLDGGIDNNGRPYLVMQYVEGIPITQYCDDHALSINERLALFTTVCNAVQHAHRNLIVHRDLKPSNILVTGEGVVKLLDFGIAKLLDPDWEMSLAITQSQMRLMTPEYAAPEQVKGEAITTATDVYALGILLYEILAGRRPYHLKNRRQSEIERIICEVAPTRPSTALTVATKQEDTAATYSPKAVSKARGIGLNRLKKMLRGDLDNIVLMAMRKEPARRYSSAEQLTEDISRFLKGLPVRAQKDKTLYRMQKFVRRHRAAVLFTTFAITTLIAFSIFATYQGSLLRVERDTAQVEKTRAEKMVGLLVSLFETANPNVTPGGDTLRVGTFVEKGARKVLQEVEDDPQLKAQMTFTLGQMYAAQGQYREAQGLLEDAYEMQRKLRGPADSVTTGYLMALATQTWRLGQREKGKVMFEKLLIHNKAVFGETHPRVAKSMQLLALATSDVLEKQALLESSLQIRQEILPANDIEIADGLNALATFHLLTSNYSLAEENYRASLDILEQILDKNHPNILAVMGNLASSLNQMGDTPQAITIQKDVISRLRTVKRDSSVQTANAWNNLAVYYIHEGKFADARDALQYANGLQTVLLGPKHHRVLSTARNLGVVLSKMGNHEAAKAIFQNINRQITTRNDQLNIETGYYFGQYANILREADASRREIEDYLQRALAAAEQTRNNDPEAKHTKIADIYLWQAMYLLENQAYAAAAPYTEDALAMRLALLPKSHPHIAIAQSLDGITRYHLDQKKEAVALLEAGNNAFQAHSLVEQQWKDEASAILADNL
ncbi:MAG: protein kinase [Bacteroidota bacterium]